MAIYNYRRGSTNTTNLTKEQLLQLEHATFSGAEYLLSIANHSTIQDKLKNIYPGNLTKVFGISSLSTIATRLSLIYEGMPRSSRNSVVTAAKDAVKNFSDIFNNADSNGAKLVTVNITYYELFNATTGVTSLTLPVKVTATRYHK
ncbi:hypothetical protein FC756_04520 [Lysinibacillus mangiferihumi]|uniref:Uncharacterized protein n=1 Tax=Lysinibacillus mangiferihumi TaxID=1130819 RepID=A0A4V5TME8_9BACI|nr:hypothetical protein [Lysinibacillus mangiferihumi]TKI71643.1 hypothetical protein FC756_04520 [Lysinibacillus mangiferihumi]